MTSSNNVSSAARGSATGGKGALQAPQRPVLARYLAATRFFCPQLLQTRMTGTWASLAKLSEHESFRSCSPKALPISSTYLIYLMAIGFVGDPTARVIGKGGAQKKNSKTWSCAQSRARSLT